MSATQNDRLLAYLQAHPERVTSFEIVAHLRILNYTARVSDLRQSGHRIDCTREGTHFQYALVGQLALSLVS